MYDTDDTEICVQGINRRTHWRLQYTTVTFTLQYTVLELPVCCGVCDASECTSMSDSHQVVHHHPYSRSIYRALLWTSNLQSQNTVPVSNTIYSLFLCDPIVSTTNYPYIARLAWSHLILGDMLHIVCQLRWRWRACKKAPNSVSGLSAIRWTSNSHQLC